MGRAEKYLTRAIKQNRVLSTSDLMLLRREFIRLEKNLSFCREERNLFVKVINDAIRICTIGDETIAELKTKNEEWEASFKLYDDAMRRGIKIWQDATKRTRIWPDAAQLTAWLIQRCDQLEKITKEYAEALQRNQHLQAEIAALGELLSGLVDVELERDELRGLFSDYEFSPTIEQCVKMWNDLMEERHQLKEDLDLHKKIRSAQADTITNLIKKDDQRFSDLQDEHLALHMENDGLEERLIAAIDNKTCLIDINGSRIRVVGQDLWDNNEKLETELAERNATLDQIDVLTKIIEPKVENLARNSDLLVEQNKELRTENEMLRETLVQREMIWGGWTRQVAEIVVGLLTNTGEKE